MRIAYLMNTYPMPSTTFIRREIRAVENQGVDVRRYVIRRWDGDLVDPGDIAERNAAHHILSGNAGGIVIALLAESVMNARGVANALGAWWTLFKSGGGFVRHCAYLAEAAYFKRCAERDQVSHVHAHFGTNATAVAMLSNLMGGPGYSFTVHGPDELIDSPHQNYPLKIRHAKFVAAISHFCRSQLNLFSENRWAEKIKIVHCGLQTDEFQPSPVPSSNSIICVGRLCHQKGQMMIPEAVAALKDKFPDITVTLIGDGDIRGELEAEIERCNVDDEVKLTGWRDNHEVREAIAAHKIFLLPSSAEGLPVVLMEAYAMQRAAISTYIAGIPELIDERTGWLFPAGSVEGLKTAIEQALTVSREDLSAMAERGRGRVLDHHDVDKEAATLIALFKEDAE